MFFIIIVVILAFFFFVLIDLFTYIISPKNYTRSLYKFVIRAPHSLVPLGVIGFGTAGLGIGIEYSQAGIIEWRHLIIVSFILIPSFMVIVAPVPRLWDVIVENQTITVIKFFVFRKEFVFSEIEYARITKGEVKVYCKNSKGVSFIVDLMSKGSTNFIKRLQKENINIIDQREEKGSNDI